MRQFYIEQSSGKYAVNGDVTDWNNVPNAGAYYGSNANSDAYAWLFVRDSINAWYSNMVAAGWTNADLSEYLSRFDVWDRYDYDGDGNFDEPDGYIDHFQSIHSGEGEEAGGGVLGDDAIWSHRWYAFYNNIGVTGPDFNKFGGIKVGNTNFWIGDYTIEPENGGVGVFAHEFGHDLGLPDEYDTSGNAGGAENSTGWWTLMSQGSWGTQSMQDIGSAPPPHECLGQAAARLAEVRPVRSRRSNRFDEARPRRAPHEAGAGTDRGPTRQDPRGNVGGAYEGAYFYYSGSADDLDTTMERGFTLPAGSVSFSAKVRYNIETDWDYAYLTVNGEPVVTNRSVETSPNGQNFGHGITGASSGWVDLTADLSAFAGQTVQLGFEYWTDGDAQGNGGAQAPGIAIDNIAVTGNDVDGAETDTGWNYEATTTFRGFHRTNGTEQFQSFNFYVAENRQYWGYDRGLRVGPYNFGFLDDPDLQDWTERFPYQDGLLVWYSDYYYSNNNVGDHPGEGLILPVDAHPEIMHWSDDGSVIRPRIQAYDATFTLSRTDGFTLHHNSNPTNIPSHAGNAVFNDRNSYYVASDPADSLGHYQAGWNSVDNPHTGTVIRVKSVTAGGMMQIRSRGTAAVDDATTIDRDAGPASAGPAPLSAGLARGSRLLAWFSPPLSASARPVMISWGCFLSFTWASPPPRP